MKKKRKKLKLFKFNLIQDGAVVASVEGEDRNRALDDIKHYALIYGQDGPVKIEEKI